jgi:phosphoglycolate phosphatase
LRIGFDMSPDAPEYIAMRDEFLDNYARAICVHTRLFDGMPSLLTELEARRIAWGIVTNKATRFTSCLVEQLRVAPACVVCGDTTPHLKPHPAPLLAAAEKLRLAPGDCVYVGDDLRDIQAARAAGMRCVAVQYGYHGADNPGPASWNADAIIDHPLELLEHL